MRALMVAGILALMVLAAPARADDEGKGLEVDARLSIAVLGWDRPTGGPMPAVEVRKAWALDGVWKVAVGAQVGLFGLGDDPHWVGVMGGPTVAVRAAPWHNGLELGLGMSADFGRLPVCNSWGLCLRYVGFFPGVAASIAYNTQAHSSFGVTVAVHDVDTLAWHGAMTVIGAFGRFDL